MKNKNIKNILIISLFLAVFSTCVFYKTLFCGDIFAWYNDQLFQHNVFYKEWYQIIRESIECRSLMFYSWNTFLGSDFFISKLMYCVGDYLITPFFILYNGEINYDILFAVTTVISIVVSSLSMYAFLYKLGIKKNHLLISLPIIYALGGFAMTYTGSYMFHRFYSLLPLLFYFVEDYIKRGRVAGFSIIIFILFLQSYELLFSTCFFLILYFIVSCKLKYNISILDILKKSLVLILSFFVGLAICGFVILPLIFFIRNNPRVGSFTSDGLFWDLKSFVGFVTASVVPAFNFRSDIPQYLFHATTHYGSEYGYFTTMLFIPAFILIFKKGNICEKKTFIISEIIILICLLFKPFNMIIHGFSVPTLRWTFLLSFYHIFVSAYALNKYEYSETYKKGINILFVLYIGMYLIYVLNYGFNISVVLNIILFAVVYLYDYLLARKNNKILAYVLIFNVAAFYVLSIYSVYGVYGKGQDSFNREYLDYHKWIDDDQMVRYYFDSDELWPYSWLNLNSSLEYNYMGVTTYDSTYESVLNDFLVGNGYNNWLIDIDKPDLWHKLGVKYVVSSTNIIPDNSEYVSDFDNFKVYKLNDYRGIGYSLNDSRNLTVVEYNHQYMKGNIESGEGLMFVAIPYSSGWYVMDQNGNRLETKNIEGGFLGVELLNDSYEISFSYLTPGLKLGAVASCIGVIAVLIEILFEKKISQKIKYY